MAIRLIDNPELWNRFMDESPYGLLFHKWEFLKILEKHTGFILMPYGIYRGNELICLFPLFFKKYMGLKLVFSPPPQTGLPYLGFVMSAGYDSLKQKRKESYLHDVAREIDAELNKISPNYVSITTVPKFSDVRPFRWQGYHVDITYTYAIDLGRPIDEIWHNFDKDCKKQIRVASMPGPTLKRACDVDGFYEIMRARFSDEELAHFHSQSPEFLKDVFRAFPENLKMYYLYDGDRVSAVSINCDYKGKSILWMGYAKGHSNEYIIWELIKKAKEDGLVESENPDATTQRLTSFKSKFNPDLRLGFNISKKDFVGRVAEWSFANVVKRWV